MIFTFFHWYICFSYSLLLKLLIHTTVNTFTITATTASINSISSTVSVARGLAAAYTRQTISHIGIAIAFKFSR